MSTTAVLRAIVAQSIIRGAEIRLLDADTGSQFLPLSLVLHGGESIINPSAFDEADQHARSGNPNGLRVADLDGVLFHSVGTSPIPGAE